MTPYLPGLSKRERQIVSRIYDGYTNQEISEELGITTRTVSTHASRAFQKLGRPNPRRRSPKPLTRQEASYADAFTAQTFRHRDDPRMRDAMDGLLDTMAAWSERRAA